MLLCVFWGLVGGGVTFSMFVISVVLKNMGLILPVAKVLLPCDKWGRAAERAVSSGVHSFQCLERPLVGIICLKTDSKKNYADKVNCLSFFSIMGSFKIKGKADRILF